MKSVSFWLGVLSLSFGFEAKAIKVKYFTGDDCVVVFDNPNSNNNQQSGTTKTDKDGACCQLRDGKCWRNSDLKGGKVYFGKDKPAQNVIKNSDSE
jgi:hypothetical protein